MVDSALFLYRERFVVGQNPSIFAGDSTPCAHPAIYQRSKLAASHMYQHALQHASMALLFNERWSRMLCDTGICCRISVS